MKKLLFSVLLMPSFLFSQVIIENFEDERHLNYAEKSGEFISDNPNYAPTLMGGMYWGIANPDMSGANTSPRCGQYNRNIDETFDYFVAIPKGGFTNLDEFTDGSNFFTLDVWTPEENTTFIISFENREIALIDPDSLDGVHSRFEATTTVSNAWHTITFSFLDFPDLNISVDEIDQMVVLVNSDQLGNDVNVYFDNLYGPDYGCMDEDPNNVFEDFECHRDIEYTFTHGGIDFVTNPDQNGINTSEKCGNYLSLGSGDDNGNVVNIFTFNTPLTLAENEVISMDVKSTFSKYVQLTLQNENNSYTSEVETSGNNEWSELTFSYSGLGDESFTQAVLIFAPGETEFGYNFYYDNLTVVESNSIDNQDLISIDIHNDYIYFAEFGNKNLKIYDLSGKLLVNELITTSFYEIQTKGLIIVDICDENGNHSRFKHLKL